MVAPPSRTEKSGPRSLNAYKNRIYTKGANKNDDKPTYNDESLIDRKSIMRHPVGFVPDSDNLALRLCNLAGRLRRRRLDKPV
jgi:hypothetical protein